MKGFILTQGRPAGYVPEERNYDDSLLSAVVILSLWSQGVADLAVVVVKLRADEGMVTCLRVKLSESDESWRQRARHVNERQSYAWTTTFKRLELKTPKKTNVPYERQCVARHLVSEGATE